MKYCIDCKHLYEYGSVCYSPRNEINLVTGKALSISAYTARENTGEFYCGPDANFFEQKEVVPVGTTVSLSEAYPAEKPWWKFWSNQ